MTLVPVAAPNACARLYFRGIVTGPGTVSGPYRLAVVYRVGACRGLRDAILDRAAICHGLVA